MSLPDGAKPELELERGLEQLGIACGTANISRLLGYTGLLLKWNSSFNLVAASDTGSMVSRHLLDSLAVHSFLEGETIVDAGSGAGLPGVPLAIVNPDKQFILVDSNGKKTRFLFQAKTAMGLGNIRIENCRIEHYQSHEHIDIVLCRAFASLKEVLARAQHLLSEKGWLLAMKGRFPRQEIAQLPEGFKVTLAKRLTVPGSDSERHLVRVERGGPDCTVKDSQ